jgi:hypothetical protein
MAHDVTRRGLLGSVATLSLGAVVGRGRAASGFDPTRHGFGFVNWAPGDGHYPTHDHESVSEDEVERVVRERWSGSFSNSFGTAVSTLPDPLLTAIARQLYVSAVQSSASNGHCWGMSYTAQHYFENPDAVPAGAETASALRHPMAPLSNPRSHPVSDDIDDFQLYQVLDVDAWVGRRGILNPRWIDLDRQIRNLVAAVEAFGTATMTLIDPRDRSSHLVLAYDVAPGGGRTDVAIYDPNVKAPAYRNGRHRVITIDHTGEGPAMEPYGRYRTFLYNDRERVVAARGQANPAPAFDLPKSALRDELLSVAVFLLDGPDAEMTVVDPAGNPVRRDWAPFATREASTYDQMRYRYNPQAGRYYVSVTARAADDVVFSVLAADQAGELVRAKRTVFLEAGESQRFTVDIPESGDETGHVERTDALPEWAVAAGSATVGALGAGGVLAGVRRLG